MFQIQQDIVYYITQYIDIISFIYLMSTCKNLFNIRKNCFTHFDKNIIYILLNSYINLEHYHIKNIDKFINDIPISKINSQKITNTLNIIRYYYNNNENIPESFEFNINLLQIISKTICKKYRYKYNTPYFRLHSLVWLDWYKCDVDIMDIFEVMYLIKNRNYRKIINLLSTIKFRNTGYIKETIDYLLNYMGFQIENKFRTPLICILYMYAKHNINIMKNDKYILFSYEIAEKANDLYPNIMKINAYPNYLKTFIINKIKTTTDMLIIL